MKHDDAAVALYDRRPVYAKPVGEGFYPRYGKRALDLALAVLMLPVIMPILALICAIARFEGGQAILAQERVGRGGRRYRCYKIRTMVPDAEKVLAELCAADPEVAAEWNTYQKLRNDPRVTRFGAFLRKTSLDELPQIFNVLSGDMSLVGPRPFMICQEETYRIAGGDAYYRVRPGITGPWQVSGRNATSFVERVEFDTEYLTTLCPLNDARLLLRTVSVVLAKTGH